MSVSVSRTRSVKLSLDLEGDRRANKSNQPTKISPIAACGLILLATRMLYKGRYHIPTVLAFSC